MTDDLHALRATFNQNAREYDAIRPGYPPALIEDVIALSGIPDGGQALEIGCGTGQATLPFAQRGYHLLCLDIGAEMIAIAREKLAGYPHVQFRQVSFEEWPARVGAYDLIYSATAFHWVPPEIGYPKAALALKPGSALAIFYNEHPRPYTGFFIDVQPIYREIVPEWDDPRERPDTEAEIQATVKAIASTRLYEPAVVRTYPWTRTYTTADYLRLLNTFSGHLRLEESRRRKLYQAIGDLIDRQYSGQVEWLNLTVLYLAKKKAEG